MSCIFCMQDILTWTELDLHLLVACFLRVRFPIVVALNKADTAEATEHIAKVQVWPLAAGGLGWQWGDPTRKVAWPDLGFCEKKPLLPITSKIGWTIYGLVFFGILHFWRFAVGSVSCSPSTRQLLKIRWPFRRAVNYGFCSSSGKASGIAVAERWSKEKDPWEAQEPDWRLRTCKVYESVGSSTDRMHESCESTLSPAEHLINSLSPLTLTLSNVNPFLLGHYDKRYQGQTSWHHTVRLLTLLGGHLTYLEGGGSNSISLTASAPIEVKEQAASVSREPWAVAILRCFEETWLKDESMK